LTVEQLMRKDAVTVLTNTSIADCRRQHPLGSSQAVFLIDGNGHYRGTVLLADIFSSDSTRVQTNDASPNLPSTSILAATALVALHIVCCWFERPVTAVNGTVAERVSVNSH
jgi:hypothetical protein